MNYNEYLFSCLLKKYDKGFEQMEYDLQYERIAQRYLGFTQSRFNVDTKGIYECIIEYLEDKYIKYFDVHVFHNRYEGFSLPVKVNTNDVDISDDDYIISHTRYLGKLDEDDAKQVDTVTEIDYDDYISMGGK